jgi:predicted dehydrogenase
LGKVARYHVEALEQLDRVQLVAAVDPAVPELYFRGANVSVYPNVRAFLAASEADYVVVATPTSTHVAVCLELVAGGCQARLLVEKPIAESLESAEELLRATAQSGAPSLQVLYHFAFAPEVLWTRDRLDVFQQEHGAIVQFDCFFSDPYVTSPEVVESLGNSWIDSGINALSVVARFVNLERRLAIRTLPDVYSSFRAVFEFKSSGMAGRGAIWTSWNATQGAKSTRLTFADGTSLTLEHTAVAVRLVTSQGKIDMAAWDGSTPRMVRHYHNLYKAMLFDRGSGLDDRQLQTLLLGE